ncbi:acyltransferase [Salmonella enterica subsp. houtenae]|uniref:Acyltransferase n=3 Tax=Salmonella enterica TaxID=28901 RepID=A0A5V0INX6_SALER|nr:acyltransferase [Salmonella enterica]EAW1730043.1 acyltransferase [Salmonella enterica subsp. enterica]EBH8332799.1 acyltransferase [Salmonella enterica subsp. houtenae serovar Houten]ECD9548594.1 acyltransferase [Salmonella enterica subsp. houtenae]ECE8271189.1 acyltransferase [Salmonella enterica subsp. enterica serovar Berkeley]ECQ6536956.1 acyltransferase [Salmonella enterica subsp. enterica serovar Kingabwa]EDT6510837.1 acyltransferase [Salmonella enterica subsp. enterica serovar Tall
MSDNQGFQIIFIFTCLIFAIVLFSHRKFSYIDRVTENDRNTRLDSLRFLMSSFVAFHHFIFSYNLVNSGQWIIPNHPIEEFAGKFGVAIFFMISGYLFVKCIEKKVNWLTFFIKRFFRIWPVCALSSVICILIVIYIKTKNNTPLNTDGIMQWFDGGLIIDRRPNLGYEHSTLINAGVTWTLYYEWMLYFSLPFISLFSSKNKSSQILLSIVFLSIYIFSKYDYLLSCFILLFALGGMAKKIREQISNVNQHTVNILAVTSFILCFYFGYKENPFTISMIFMYFVFFISVCLGADIFGVLRLKGIIRLGDVSYSIYLLHAIFWFIMNKLIFSAGFENSQAIYYTASFLTWIFICVFSSIVYALLEVKFIHIGNIICKKITNSNIK